MTVPPEPGDFNRPGLSEEDQRLRASIASELPPRPSSVDREGILQADPIMVEGEASRTRIVVYAIAALLIMCVVFYGMGNNRSNTTASAPPAPPTAANKMAANPLPPIRNIAPDWNALPGMTTGAAAPSDLPRGPASAPTGAITR